MRTHRLAALTVGVAAVTASCGTSTSGPEAASSNGIGDAIEVAAEAPGEAETTACAITRTTLETAVEAYTAMNGVPPSSQDELIGLFLAEPARGFQIGAAGVVEPIPNGPCEGQ
jgi:hypothetical protein